MIELVTPEKNFRNLADTLAVPIVKAGLRHLERMPGKDFGGDLARKMGIRLAFNGRPPLTPQERVGCASYAQNIPNLNELVGSDRLMSLLAEDLQMRRNTTAKKAKKQAPPKQDSKGFGNTPPKSTARNIAEKSNASKEAGSKGPAKKGDKSKKSKK